MQLRVRSITYLADGINGYELVDPKGHDLPRFEAGAHIAVKLAATGAAEGVLRDYSLWNEPAERRRYSIAVLREKEGQGSRHLHETVRVGDLVEVSPPRNNFPLTEAAERHLFLAGGIGITPIMAMIAEMRRRRAEFVLHYCTRSPETTAFFDELSLLAAQGRVFFHHDGGDPARGLDIAALLLDRPAGTHLYYCGPRGLMEAAAAASAHWPHDAVHCEYFKGPEAVPPQSQPYRKFRVRLAKSGGEYDVLPDEAIIEALRRNGVTVRTSCELGYCCACLTRYLSGEVDHRDQILTDTARRDYLLTCCSRAKSDTLVLDL
jgi:vanillate O-demethylase ferredoxin subunit